jgi:L-asparaginase II
MAYIVSCNDNFLFAHVTASVATCLKAADKRCTCGYTSCTVPEYLVTLNPLSMLL